MQITVAKEKPKDIQIVYSNVGIDNWNTEIDLNDTISDYSTLVRQLNLNKDKNREQDKLFFSNNLIIPDPKNKRNVYYLAKDGKCVGTVDNGFNRNMCENGCLAVYPPVATVMNQHIKNAIDVSHNADFVLLNEMCKNKIKDITGTHLLRIKRKDSRFRNQHDWVDKVDLVAIRDNNSSSESFYYNELNAVKTVPASLDENSITEKELGLVYNANLSKHVLSNGETLLIWFVHWPVLNKPYIYNEVTGIMKNIEDMLKAKPCNFVAIGDFNTNAPKNSELFEKIWQKLTRTQSYKTYHDFKKNDGYIACLNPKTFSGVTVNYNLLGTSQPFSAHTPMGLTLKVVIPPSPVIMHMSQETTIVPKLQSNIQSKSPMGVQKPVVMRTPVIMQKPMVTPKTPVVPVRKSLKMVQLTEDKAKALLTQHNKDSFDANIINGLASNFVSKSKIKSIFEDDFASSVYTQLKQLLRFDKTNKLTQDEIEALKPKIDVLITSVLEEFRHVTSGGSLNQYRKNKKAYKTLNAL